MLLKRTESDKKKKKKEKIRRVANIGKGKKTCSEMPKLALKTGKLMKKISINK